MVMKIKVGDVVRLNPDSPKSAKFKLDEFFEVIELRDQYGQEVAILDKSAIKDDNSYIFLTSKLIIDEAETKRRKRVKKIKNLTD